MSKPLPIGCPWCCGDYEFRLAPDGKSLERKIRDSHNLADDWEPVPTEAVIPEFLAAHFGLQVQQVAA